MNTDKRWDQGWAIVILGGALKNEMDKFSDKMEKCLIGKRLDIE